MFERGGFLFDFALVFHYKFLTYGWPLIERGMLTEKSVGGFDRVIGHGDNIHPAPVSHKSDFRTRVQSLGFTDLFWYND